MLTVKQVAEMLNISVRTVYRLLENDEFPSYKIGGSVRIKQSDVEAYVERNKQQ